MSSIFKNYLLLKDSGLFDEDYYINAYPEIKAANLDPLLHYLETGAAELRNPSESFNAREYVQLCQARGEQVDNPLIHYIESRAAHGLTSRPPREVVAIHGSAAPAAAAALDFILHVEGVELQTSKDTARLTGFGWCVAASDIVELEIRLGATRASARHRLQRGDVARAFPQFANAGRSGFEFVLEPPADAVSGLAELVFTAATALGGRSQQSVPIDLNALRAAAIRRAAAGAADANEATGSGSNVPCGASPQSAGGGLQFNVDLPRVVDGSAVAPIRDNLEIVGWALAREGVASVDIGIDGQKVKSVTTGIRRIDVQQAFPTWDGALMAGFSALLPHRSLAKGHHVVSISLRDQAGQSARSEFRIEVEDAPDEYGPGSLRRRLSAREIDVLSRPLAEVSTRPSFGIVLVLTDDAKSLRGARLTLASIETQVYGNWRVYVLARAHRPKTLRHSLLEGLDDELAARVTLVGADGQSCELLPANGEASHFMILRPGDRLGCDALLEFAVHVTLHPEAELLYADERRLSRTSAKVEAFFKPQWSPDLMLSMNYLGRAWCARVDLVRRAAIGLNDFIKLGDYDLALRLTEHAAAIHHVPATLLQSSETFVENATAARKALQAALVRRGVQADVKAGRIQGTFRVQRGVATRGLVSIIIPTCGARGLIRKCIETLRGLTAYPNFEIICIENIPEGQGELQDWLRARVTAVLSTAESFNWSRFNNLAVAAARGEFLLFLNDDIEIIDAAWLDVLLEHAQRTEVGAVGPQLLYPDRRVQHAGMFLAGQGLARHAFRCAAEDDPGYFGLALTQRNVIAVTGACLMTRRATFEAVGGFDETHDIINNDVDYCLRVWRLGLRTVYTPYTKLIHHELASRSEIADSYDAAAFAKKWRSVFIAGDPFFHPRLTKDRDDYSFDWEPTQMHCAGHPVLPRASIRRILVVKLDHIGDCVIALPAIRRLKSHFPEARISVLTSPASRAIWALEPAVEELIEFEFFHARSGNGLVGCTEEDWRVLRERLAPHRFDLAIDLRKHWETRSVLRCSGARYFAGFDVKGKFPWLDVALEWSEDCALLPKRQHAADDLVNLIDAVAAASEADRDAIPRLPALLADEALERELLSKKIFQRRVVCVHAFAGNEMRQWPVEFFSALIDQLIEVEGVHVILIGGADDIELSANILSSTANPKAVWSLVGRVGLGSLPVLIARCALFVGNNSGPQHIAARVGVATIGIHSGVVDAREWGPQGTCAVAIQRAMTCAPCYLFKVEECGRGLACLRGLLPEDVFRVCQRLLGPPEALRLHGNATSLT